MGKKTRKPGTTSTRLVTTYTGQDAQDAWNAMLLRMQKNPENFEMGSNLDIFNDAGYFCTGCGEPTKSTTLSECCQKVCLPVNY
jgi:hypothetical protein